MAGVIATQINQQNPLSSVAGYDPERIQMDEDKDTVEGRVRGIIAKNSPLMQSAATRATQQSNSKGLLNSSMAIGDAQRAVYDVALPIASQDASTSFQSKALNQQAGNTALSETARAQTTGALQQRQGQQAVEQIQTQGVISRQLAERQAELDRQTQSQLESQRGENTLAQIQAQGGIQSQLQSEQGAISQQLQAQQIALQKEMQLAIQSNDIAAQRDIQARAAEIEKQLQEIRGQQALEQQAAGGDIQKELARMDITAREQFLERQAVIDREMQSIVGDQAMAQIGEQGTIQSKLLAEKAIIDERMQTADIQSRERLVELQGQVNSQLQELGGDIESRLIAERADLEKDLQLAIQNNDLAAQKDLLDKRGEIDLRIQAAGGDIQAGLQVQRMELEKDLQLALQNNDLASRERILGVQHQIDRDLLSLQASENRETLELQDLLDFERTSKLADIEQNYTLQRDAILASQTADRDQQLADLDQERNEQIQGFELGMQQLQQNHETSLNQLRNSHEVIMQSSVNGANIYNSMMTALSAMYQNPDMSPQERNAGANDIIDMANTSLATLNQITGVDNSAIFGAGGSGGGNYGGVLDGGTGGSNTGGQTGGQGALGNSGLDVNYQALNIDPQASSVVQGSSVQALSDQVYNIATANGTINPPLNVVQSIPVLAAGTLAPIALDVVRGNLVDSLRPEQVPQVMEAISGIPAADVQGVATARPITGMGEEEFFILGQALSPFRNQSQRDAAENKLMSQFGWSQQEVDAYIAGVQYGLIDASISTYYGGGQ